MTLDRVNTSMERLGRNPGPAYISMDDREPWEVMSWVTRLATMAREAERDAEIVREGLILAMRDARDTHTLQEIGDAAGLSKQRVQQLLKEEK